MAKLLFDDGGLSLLQKAFSTGFWGGDSDDDGEIKVGEEPKPSAIVVDESQVVWVGDCVEDPYFLSHSWTLIERSLKDPISGDDFLAEYAVHRLVLNSRLATDLNTKIMENTLVASATAQGIQASNIGGWHSDRDALLQSCLLQSTVFGDIIEMAARCIATVEAARLARPIAPLLLCDECWINLSTGESYNSLHNHPGATLSGVLAICSPHVIQALVLVQARGLCSH